MPTKWLRQLRHEFGPLGVEVRRGSKHLRLELPTGQTLTAASTPSARRAIYNVRADVKRALRSQLPQDAGGDIMEAPPTQPVEAEPQIARVCEPERDVIIERPGIVEPPRIVMADVVYHYTSSAQLPLILLSGQLTAKRDEVLWATPREDSGRLFSPAFYYHEMFKKRYMREIRFTCNSHDFRKGVEWRKLVKKPGIYWRKARELGQSLKEFQYRKAPLDIDNTLIEMRTYGGPWVPVEEFSIIDLPGPGMTAIRLDDLVYISKRVSQHGIGFMPPVPYDMLSSILKLANPTTYEEAAVKYAAPSHALEGCLPA